MSGRSVTNDLALRTVLKLNPGGKQTEDEMLLVQYGSSLRDEGVIVLEGNGLGLATEWVTSNTDCLTKSRGHRIKETLQA